MSADRPTINRRDFLKATGVIAGSSLLAACNTGKYVASLNFPTETATDLASAKMKTPTPVPTQKSIPTSIEKSLIPPIEKRFKLGTMNFGNTPFTLETTPSLMQAMGYIGDQTVKYHAEFPLPVTVSYFGSDEQIKIMDKAAVNNSAGNPYYVYITDRSNHLFLSFHSLQITSPGDLARDIGGKIYGHQEKQNKILGQKVIFTPENQKAFEAEVVYVATIPGDYYYEGDDKQFPWGWNPDYNLAWEGLTDAFYIPENIRNDKSPNTYYVTIFSCQTKNPGEIPDKKLPYDQRAPLISANSAMLTLKFTLP